MSTRAAAMLQTSVASTVLELRCQNHGVRGSEFYAGGIECTPWHGHRVPIGSLGICLTSVCGTVVSPLISCFRYTDPHVYDGPPSTEESGGLQTGEPQLVCVAHATKVCSHECERETFWTVGGWVAKYSSGAHDLTFLTVKGAGHMSPQWKPLATITWLSRWLNGTTM